MTSQGSAGTEAWRRELLDVLRADAAVPGKAVGTRPKEGSDRIEALAFRLGAETYGVEIHALTEIVLPKPVTPLPRAPAFIRGVASLRGAVLPVVDLARRLGLPPRDDGSVSRILVLRDGDERMGFWTGPVVGVVRFTPAELENAAFASAIDPKFLRGLGYNRAGTLIALLNAERLCDFDLEAP